ncbi:hypothetical protein D9C73_018248 [Collichthys lucidus]|uniref:Uncharacterized protein n=1 Tax=Collichthys lucidus TaxID=240159 RepID=A0A4U5VAF6_COLLU|nr:hypothetical protein D9C73_018248 [Collichthys lucidus]
MVQRQRHVIICQNITTRDEAWAANESERGPDVTREDGLFLDQGGSGGGAPLLVDGSPRSAPPPSPANTSVLSPCSGSGVWPVDVMCDGYIRARTERLTGTAQHRGAPQRRSLELINVFIIKLLKLQFIL